MLDTCAAPLPFARSSASSDNALLCDIIIDRERIDSSGVFQLLRLLYHKGSVIRSIG